MLRNRKTSSDNPKILILEDDSDQMELLISFALSEINKIRDDEHIDNEQKLKIGNIKIIKVSNYESLKKAVVMHDDVLLALLDCNTPDAQGATPNDQLVVTTDRGITGQHKSVDLVIKHLPDTPITIISSMDRFQRIVNKYYASRHELSITFIRKTDPPGLKENIRDCLRTYLATAG